MDDRDLARLLSGRREPSVLEKEEVFARVLDQLEPRARPRRVRWAIAAALTVAAAAAALLLRVQLQEGGEQFAARGGQARKPALRALCVETGQQGACPAHGTLAFELEPQGYGYAALFARAEDGSLTWYFPRADGQSLSLHGARGLPLRQGVRLGDSQPPGRYELVLVLSRAPLARAEVKARLAGGSDVLVISQPLVVQAAQ